MHRIVLVILSIAMFFVTFACADARPHHMSAPEFLSSPETRALGLPFSDAVRVGRTLYVSGQIGNVSGSFDIAPGGIQPQARRALENIRAIVERNGSSMDRVVKCTVFLLDIEDWLAFNEVYVEFFPSDPPARSALAASGLAIGAKVEIECIAVVGRSH